MDRKSWRPKLSKSVFKVSSEENKALIKRKQKNKKYSVSKSKDCSDSVDNLIKTSFEVTRPINEEQKHENYPTEIGE